MRHKMGKASLSPQVDFDSKGTLTISSPWDGLEGSSQQLWLPPSTPTCQITGPPREEGGEHRAGNTGPAVG